ncbi:MAG: hypothetical protein CMD46_04000 [Gammaproteobacteria bacterium]|nr:hypothetical protein [Gammaproteobacteria bacterium]|tara:strand:- start:5067 stop:5663 length:597 start_codon:yes stop_codon:yes gene_type:complete
MQKFRKIGIFLLPGQKAAEEIYSMKKYFKSFENKQNFLNDFPHLTLLHGIYGDYKNLEKNIKKNINLIKELKNYSYELNRQFIFEDDVEKNFSTLVYLIDNPEPIQTFQIKLLNKFKPFKGSEFLNLSNEFINDFKKYNYPFVGENLIPHFTVTNINNLDIKEKNKFLSKSNKINEKFHDLVIAEITSKDLKVLEKLW